jgi:hypothetical protein
MPSLTIVGEIAPTEAPEPAMPVWFCLSINATVETGALSRPALAR